MKKFAQITLSSLFVASMFTACSQPASVSNVADEQVSAQAAGNVTLKFDKQNSSTAKKTANTIKGLKDVKDLNFNFKNLQAGSGKKDVTDLKVTFKQNLKNDIYPTNFAPGYFQDERQLAQYANYALSSMNSQSTYENGYRVGIQALELMANDGVYVGRLSWAAANATKNWSNGYKVCAAALSHMAQQRPNSAYEACNLAVKMINAADTYEDGYRAGYAAMQVVNSTDNYTIRSISGSALQSANAVSSYSDGYRILVNAFQQIGRM